jgi:signal transduction histidine kinase
VLPRDLASLLQEKREQVVARFVAEVMRKDLSPPGVLQSFLVDHIPSFLDDIIDELRTGGTVRFTQEAMDTSVTARRHGWQRWSLGYDLQGLVREYGILRHCIVQLVKEEGVALSIDEFDVLAKCLSVGVAEAASEYARHRDEELNREKANLEFIAEAGQLLSSSLDYRSTLNRLTKLLVPRLADLCVVHLDGAAASELSLAHIDPAKGEVLRDLYRRFPLPSDWPHGYPVVLRTGEAQLVAHADPRLMEVTAQSPEHLALLRILDICSWIVVPLRVQENVVGALSLAYSDSKRHYGEGDLVLANEVARCAAVAIDNARLYELSQRERSRVEVATRAKDEFVAMVSHELRTPLNSILGWLRLIRGGSLPETKREHALEVIERNAQAQSQLIADLLDVSRVVTGKIRINPSEIDLASIVAMTIEGVRPAADAKEIRLEVDMDPAGIVLRADGDRLQQVIWNLVVNAVKFTKRKGLIRVRVRRTESEVELSVQDDGEGIPAAFLPHVFETFRQSESVTSRSHGGLGIGLSIVKHLVELHGGSIDAQSPGAGQGATFTVRLPTTLLTPAQRIRQVPATTAEATPTSLPVGLEHIRVLVVDDDPDARELVAYVLETCGMEVHTAASASDARTELGAVTPHVIISDIGMPQEDGYSLIRSIRTLAAEDKKNIPAIALTAFAANEDRTRALVEGFNVYMAKPVEPTALVMAVTDLAGRPPLR